MWTKCKYILLYVRWNQSGKIYYFALCSSMTKSPETFDANIKLTGKTLKIQTWERRKKLLWGKESNIILFNAIIRCTVAETSACSTPKQNRYSQVLLFYTALCLILRKSLNLHTSKRPWSHKKNRTAFSVNSCQLPLHIVVTDTF